MYDVRTMVLVNITTQIVCHDIIPSKTVRDVTLVFSLTLTSACGVTFSGLSPAALPSCANCSVSDDQCFPDSDR